MLVPFWGGAPEVDKDGNAVGNAHSKVSTKHMVARLKGVLCAARRVFPGAALVVGAASDVDENLARTALPPTPPADVLRVEARRAERSLF